MASRCSLSAVDNNLFQRLQLVRDLESPGTQLHWKLEHALPRLLENNISM